MQLVIHAIVKAHFNALILMDKILLEQFIGLHGQRVVENALAAVKTL